MITFLCGLAVVGVLGGDTTSTERAIAAAMQSVLPVAAGHIRDGHPFVRVWLDTSSLGRQLPLQDRSAAFDRIRAAVGDIAGLSGLDPDEACGGQGRCIQAENEAGLVVNHVQPVPNGLRVRVTVRWTDHAVGSRPLTRGFSVYDATVLQRDGAMIVDRLGHIMIS